MLIRGDTVIDTTSNSITSDLINNGWFLVLHEVVAFTIQNWGKDLIGLSKAVDFSRKSFTHVTPSGHKHVQFFDTPEELAAMMERSYVK